MNAIHLVVAMISGSSGAIVTTVFHRRTFAVLRTPNGAAILPFTPAASPLEPPPPTEFTDVQREVVRMAVAILDSDGCRVTALDPVDYHRTERIESDLPPELLLALDMRQRAASVRLYEAPELIGWQLVGRLFMARQGTAWTLKAPGQPPRHLNPRHAMMGGVDSAHSRFTTREYDRRMAEAANADRAFLELARRTVTVGDANAPVI